MRFAQYFYLRAIHLLLIAFQHHQREQIKQNFCNTYHETTAATKMYMKCIGTNK